MKSLRRALNMFYLNCFGFLKLVLSFSSLVVFFCVVSKKNRVFFNFPIFSINFSYWLQTLVYAYYFLNPTVQKTINSLCKKMKKKSAIGKVSDCIRTLFFNSFDKQTFDSIKQL